MKSGTTPHIAPPGGVTPSGVAGPPAAKLHTALVSPAARSRQKTVPRGRSAAGAPRSPRAGSVASTWAHPRSRHSSTTEPGASGSASGGSAHRSAGRRPVTRAADGGQINRGSARHAAPSRT